MYYVCVHEVFLRVLEVRVCCPMNILVSCVRGRLRIAMLFRTDDRDVCIVEVCFLFCLRTAVSSSTHLRCTIHFAEIASLLILIRC